MASHAVHACAVGASIERTGTAGTVERCALLGPCVAAYEGARDLHGMTSADAVPTWIHADAVPTWIRADGADVRRAQGADVRR